MRDAAVGFQCPSCVSEGSKQTRSGRTAYGGQRSANPALTSIALILTNVGVWLAILASGASRSEGVNLLGLRPLGGCVRANGTLGDFAQSACGRMGGTFLPNVVDGAYWQLVTSQFLHVQVWHIAGNMLALWVLGPQLEAALGRTRFLALYLLSGLAGSTAVLWLSPEFQLTLGASGATYGLFAAFAVIVHKVGGDLRSIGMLLAINVFITFAVPNISWQAHLGGLLGGMAIAAILVYAPRTRRTQVQALGLAGLAALLVVLIVVRTASLA
jgi:membrane associated rhomboid family serine protease